MAVQDITGKAEFDEIVNNSGHDVNIAILFTDGSQACEYLSSIFDELSNDLPGPRYIKVDIRVKENEEILAAEDTKPTFVILKNGGTVEMIVSPNPDQIEAILKYLYSRLI